MSDTASSATTLALIATAATLGASKSRSVSIAALHRPTRASKRASTCRVGSAAAPASLASRDFAAALLRRYASTALSQSPTVASLLRRLVSIAPIVRSRPGLHRRRPRFWFAGGSQPAEETGRRLLRSRAGHGAPPPAKKPESVRAAKRDRVRAAEARVRRRSPARDEAPIFGQGCDARAGKCPSRAIHASKNQTKMHIHV